MTPTHKKRGAPPGPRIADDQRAKDCSITLKAWEWLRVDRLPGKSRSDKIRKAIIALDAITTTATLGGGKVITVSGQAAEGDEKNG